VLSVAPDLAGRARDEERDVPAAVGQVHHDTLAGGAEAHEHVPQALRARPRHRERRQRDDHAFEPRILLDVIGEQAQRTQRRRHARLEAWDEAHPEGARRRDLHHAVADRQRDPTWTRTRERAREPPEREEGQTNEVGDERKEGPHLASLRPPAWGGNVRAPVEARRV
jgi:hypothetical protein